MFTDIEGFSLLTETMERRPETGLQSYDRFFPNQDTLPRPPAESQMKEFRPLALGSVRLEKGRGQLALRALQIPGGSVMDVRRVNLTLRK